MGRRPLFPLADEPVTRALIATGAMMLAMFVVLLPASFLDPRDINGAGVWEKPLKFSLALGLHFFSLAVLVQLLEPRRRGGFALSAAAAAACAAAVFEIAYIALQAARGRRSHFNFETAFETGMYSAMGVGAVLLIVLPFVAGALLARQRDADRSGVKLGAVLGLTIGPILTLLFAGYMSASGSHYAGAPNLGGPSDGSGVPFFGWSWTQADLRPAHFVATHLIQALPLVGLAADGVAPRLARPLVFVATIALGGLAVLLFSIAVGGRAPLSVLP